MGLLTAGAELSGAPTAISQRWPGCPCAGFSAVVAMDGRLIKTGLKVSVDLTAEKVAGKDWAWVESSALSSPSLLLQASKTVITSRQAMDEYNVFILKYTDKFRFMIPSLHVGQRPTTAKAIKNGVLKLKFILRGDKFSRHALSHLLYKTAHL